MVVVVSETNPRREARELIVQAVNRFKVRRHARHPYTPVLVGQRHIQQAVCIARHHGLVKPEVLAAAGFRERSRR